MKTTFKPILLGSTLLLVMLSSFAHKASTEPAVAATMEAKQGKAYWYAMYTLLGSKKLYITPVFNNDCNHCGNEIAEAFKKYLVMNDYDSKASTVHIITKHDVKESSAKERRDEDIYKRKQQGFSVSYVSFSYQKD